jgi:DNA recombination protein RmuC
MTNVLLLLVLVLLLAAVALLVWVLRRQERGTDLSPLVARLEASDRGQERIERAVREEVARNREEAGKQAQGLRQEVGATLKAVSETLAKTMDQLGTAQRTQLETFSNQLGKLTESNQQKLDGLRIAVEQKLTAIQEDNARKLEDMRKTVDEKLQTTLEKRLGESFKLVSDRLEQVRTGLSEVQNIASSVGDLKKVLTNVKTRGTWGEVQLGNLLEQMLSPDQYAANVATRPDSNERVEFAIKLPGRDEGDGQTVWLPVDAKFPTEGYRGSSRRPSEGADAVEAAARQIETLIAPTPATFAKKYSTARHDGLRHHVPAVRGALRGSSPAPRAGRALAA